MADRRLRIKKSLESTLSDVKWSGSFLTSGSFGKAFNPGLEVFGAGLIGLPLSAAVAKNIIQASHASPFGKGSKTLIDESIRNSWELNADQFSLRNPAWKTQIANLLTEVVSGLGLIAEPTEIQAEIYKLVLYEEGAFFLPHQDTEKTDGMFGTLVISLPSKHEGGDVVASHRGESRTFSSSSGSEFDFSYAAWYSDITHEVKPVTSGYRIVLTYNLIHRPSAMLLGNRVNVTARLTSVLESWAGLCKEAFPTPDQPVEWFPDDEGACPTALLYNLDHKYTPAELSFARLKGVDQARVAELRKACEQTDFPVFLANIVRSEMGSVDEYASRRWGYDSDPDDGPYHGYHRIQESFESSLKLSHIIEPQDRVFAKEVDISDDADIFVQDDAFGEDPDDEDFEGYTGNAGATTTHFYRRTVKNFIFYFPPHFGHASSNCVIVYKVGLGLHSTDTLA